MLPRTNVTQKVLPFKYKDWTTTGVTHTLKVFKSACVNTVHIPRSSFLSFFLSKSSTVLTEGWPIVPGTQEEGRWVLWIPCFISSCAVQMWLLGLAFDSLCEHAGNPHLPASPPEAWIALAGQAFAAHGEQVIGWLAAVRRWFTNACCCAVITRRLSELAELLTCCEIYVSKT